MYVWHSTNTCLAGCSLLLKEHSGESNPDTFLKCRNFLRPILSILIWTTRALAALQRPLWIFNVYFVGFGQSACNFLPVFSLDQASSQRLRVFWSDANFIVTFSLPSLRFFTVYPESHLLHFPFLFFALLNPLASFATTSASSIPFLFWWAGIHWRWVSIPLALRSSICYVIACIICGAKHLLVLSKACSAAWLSVNIWILKPWFWPSA